MPSIKASPIQGTVVVRRLQGHSKTRIAQELGIGRNTVARILSDSEVEQRVQESKNTLLDATVTAADTIARKVKHSASDAWELLDRTNVLPKRNGGDTQSQVAIGLFFNQDNGKPISPTTSPAIPTITVSPTKTETETK